jgi:hypothetical protein
MYLAWGWCFPISYVLLLSTTEQPESHVSATLSTTEQFESHVSLGRLVRDSVLPITCFITYYEILWFKICLEIINNESVYTY